jgi:hypothetical protein
MEYIGESKDLTIPGICIQVARVLVTGVLPQSSKE